MRKSRADFWDAVARAALPVLLLAVVLLPPHVHPPLHAVVAGVALLLALALLGADRLPAPGAATAAPLLAVGFLTVSSVALSLQPMRSVRIVGIWVAGAIVYLASRYAPGVQAARRAACAIAIAGALVSALGLWQSLVAFPAASATPVPAATRPDEAERGPGDAGAPAAAASDPRSRKDEAIAERIRSGRAVGTMGIPALLASILILGIPVATAAAISARGPGRWLWAAMALIQAGGLVATRSLGGIGALALAAGLGAPAVAGWSRGRRRAVAALVLLAAAAAIVPRLTGSGETTAAGSLGLRVANWRAAASMILSEPILGVGPDNYGVAFPAHRTWASNETQHAHNAYLEILSDLGLLVAPFVLIGLVRFGRHASAACARTGLAGAPGPWGPALAIGCAAWAIQACFDFTPWIAASAVPFLAAAGLLAREADRAGDASVPSAVPGTPTRAALLATAVVALAVGVPDAVSRRQVERAVEALEARDLPGAVDAARRAATWNPWDPEPRVLLAGVLLDRALSLPPGDPGRGAEAAEALHEAEEAVRLDPRTANRRETLAMARLAGGDVAGAYAAMAAAVSLNPFRPEYATRRDALLARLVSTPVREPGAGGTPGSATESPDKEGAPASPEERGPAPGRRAGARP